MKVFFTIVFILNLLNAGAQYLDSLKNAAIQLSSDTERVNLFYKEGFKARNKDPQLAFGCAEAGYALAIKSNSKKHTAKIYNLLGVLHYKKGDYKTALGYHQKALRLRKECNDLQGTAFSQNNLGNIYSDLKMFADAERAYLTAIEIYTRLNDEERIVSCLMNIGAIKHNLKQYDAAIQNYTLAMQKLAENDYESRAIFLTNIAEAFVGNGQIEKAIACNQDALKMKYLAENNLETADNYLNLGGIYIIQKDFEKAGFYIDTAMHIADKYNYAELKYKARKIKAIFYSETKDFERAFLWLKKYNDMGDSILAAQYATRQFFDFSEQDKMTRKAGGFSFPYMFLNVLLLIAILITVTLFKLKR